MSEDMTPINIAGMVQASEKIFLNSPTQEGAQRLLAMAIELGQSPRLIKDAIKIFRRLASKPWHTLDTEQHALKGFTAHVNALPDANERVHILRSVIMDVRTPPALRDASLQGIIQNAGQVTDRYMYDMAIRSALNTVEPGSTMAGRLNMLTLSPPPQKPIPTGPKVRKAKAVKPDGSTVIDTYLTAVAQQIMGKPVAAGNARLLHQLRTAAKTLSKKPEHHDLCKEIFKHIAAHPLAGEKQKENAHIWLDKLGAEQTTRSAARPPDAPAGQPQPQNPAHG